MPNKIMQYSGLAAALLTCEKLKAQIAYTNIEPNTVIDNSYLPIVISEVIDLNNDGIIDLTITSFFDSYYGYSGYIIKAFPQHLAQIGVERGFIGRPTDAEDVQFGDMIGSSLKIWKRFGYLMEFIEPTQDWADGLEHYLPIRFPIKEQTHYGWLRLRINPSGPAVQIMDYAYNIIPDEPIAAGNIAPCGDGFENNPGIIKPVEAGHIYHGLIDNASDRDVFQWNYVFDADNPNVQISLSDLPENYDLKLYDGNQALIAQSKNNGVADEKIFFNGTLTPGLYYIQVNPGNVMQFDSSNCYSLQIEKRNTPYRIEASQPLPPREIITEGFPNPAQDQITFWRNDEFITSITIMDITGNEILFIQVANEQPQVSIDISHLIGGTYFARMVTQNGITVSKFIIARND